MPSLASRSRASNSRADAADRAAATSLPAYRSANETTFICAKPNVSSTLGDTSHLSGSKTRPLITGVTSILICASPFWTVSLVTIFSRALTPSPVRPAILSWWPPPCASSPHRSPQEIRSAEPPADRSGRYRPISAACCGEEIDGGAALERKIGLRRDERDRLDQQAT